MMTGKQTRSFDGGMLMLITFAKTILDLCKYIKLNFYKQPSLFTIHLVGKFCESFYDSATKQKFNSPMIIFGGFMKYFLMRSSWSRLLRTLQFLSYVFRRNAINRCL